MTSRFPSAQEYSAQTARHPALTVIDIRAEQAEVTEAYRNEEEKVNLLYWQLTCRMFCTPEEWQWWFKTTGYTGDHSFIYFE